MAPAAVAVPVILTDPGYLFGAPLASTVPTMTVTGSKFTDSWDTAWLPLGATEDGSQFSYNSTVEAVSVAEFFDPIKYSTTGRAGTFAFNMASWTATNLARALNKGMPKLTPQSGTGATALAKVEPPSPGNEVRVMIGWESLDNTVRAVFYQTLQGGEIASAFRKAPAIALIPVTWNFEVPASGIPFSVWTAGQTRGDTTA